MSQFRLFLFIFLGLSVPITLAGCGGAAGSGTQTAQPIAVSVSPGSATLIGGATQTFSVTVSNDSANAGVNWQVSAGSITPAGVYTAPSPVTTPSATVTATSKSDPSKFATATITLTPISVALSPTVPASMAGGSSQPFTATIANDGSNSGVVWTVTGGGSFTASTTLSGLATNYISARPVTSATATVTATSVKDPTKSASATIPLTPIAITLTSNAIALTGDGIQTATIGASITGDGSASGATFVVSGTGGGTMSASPVSGNSPYSVYTAPIVSAASSSVITVASVADPTKSQTVAVTLNSQMSFTTVPGALTAGIAGAVYPNTTIGVAGGTGTKTFAVASGSLPGGLTLSAAGVISGTPTGPLITSSFTVRVTDQSAAPSQLTAAFSIGVSAPQLLSVAPSSVAVGAASTTATLTGVGFGPTTTVYLNGYLTPTTYISPQSVSFILASQTYTGSLSLYVRNLSYISNTLTIPIVNPVPILTSISPAGVVAGSPSFPLTLNGSNITSATTVLINGVSHTFFSSSSTTVTVTVNASEVTTVGNLPVMLTNPAPGGGNSATLQLPVISADNRLRTLNYATSDVVADPVRNLLYASVSTTSPTSPNSIVAIDPLQGTVVTTQTMASQPGQLAMSDDGSYLYAVLSSTGQVSRLLLPSLTPDITIPTWSGGPEDIEVAPGLPHTIAAAGVPLGIYADSVAIYDDAVERPLIPPTSYSAISFDTIAWGADATVLYSTMSGTSGGPEFILSVNPNGSTLSATKNSALTSFTKRLTYDKTSGRLYDGGGDAVDAASGNSVGHFNVTGGGTGFAVDTADGKLFFIGVNSYQYGSTGYGPDIQAFDSNTFSFINAIDIPGVSGSKLVHWGVSGLAIGGGSQIYLVDGPFVSSTGVSSAIGGYVATSPTLTTISPLTVQAGSPDIAVTLKGKNFTQAAVVTWNSQTLQSTWQSSTQITATIPAAMLATPVTSTLQVSNGPGTENSGGVPFTVLPILDANLQISALPLSGQDMAVDPVRGLLYVAVTNPAVPNGNSIAIVDPAASAIQSVVFTGNQPWSLGVSDDGQYLYSGFETLAAVKRFKLPAMSLDLTIPLSAGGPSESYAGEVKVAPGQNQTIAVAMGNPAIEPRSAGGIGIFDGTAERPNAIPPGGTYLFKLTWGKDATRLFANSDPVFQPQNAAILTVDSNGISSTTGVSSGLGYIGLRSHYDSGTNLVYSDGGNITNLATGSPVGVLKANGPMVPDSTLNRAFFLQQDATLGGGYYDIVIFDLQTQTLLKTIPISQLAGVPTQMVRWGSQGLAFLTDSYGTGDGMLYILQGSDISGLSTPPPGAITLNPASVVEGAAAGITITVTGSNFTSTSTIEVNGSARATTFVSATQLTFQLTAADQAFPTYLSVVVSNAGGTTSPATSLSILNPAPAIKSLGSSNVLVGTYATFTVRGTGFIPSTVVQWNGSPRPTTYISPTQVTATPNFNDFAALGKYPVTVVNPMPGGGTSNAVMLEVDNPVPAIMSLSPSAVATGSAGRSVNVFGSGFTAGTVIQVGGTARVTTYSSSTLVSVALTTADFATAGNLSLVAVNPSPGGGSSAAASIVVSSGLLGPVTLSPSTLLTGATTPTTITVTGTNFATATYVQFGNTVQTTAFISSTQITFQLTVAEQASAGTFNVFVINPSPGGSSVVATLTLSAPVATPVITSLSPPQLTVGSSGITLSIYGSGFTSSSTIQWNGAPLANSYSYSSGYIVVPIPASLLSATGTVSITVSTPSASPSLSNALSLSIVNPPVPTLTSMTPTSGPINVAFTATLAGTGFAESSVVAVNGTAVPTTFVSSTQLTAAVPANLIPPGNLSLTVTTPAPGGGISSAVNFTSYIPIVNNSMIYNPTNGLFYLSVPSSAGAPYANSVVSLDPVSGALGTPIFVGSEPNRLALTSDGLYLWVGLDGAHAVRKVDLVAGTAGLQFSIPPYIFANSNAALTAFALASVPGQPDSVIVSAGASQFAYSTITIYDGGAARPNPITLFTSGIYSLQVDGTRNEVYSAASSFSTYNTYTYNASGLSPKTSVSAGLLVNYEQDRIQLVSGRIYTDHLTVLDAESGALLGTFSAPANYSSYSAPAAIDSTSGLAFLLDASVAYSQLPNQIEIFKLSDFSQSGTATIPINLATNSYNEPVATSFGLIRWGTNGLALDNGLSVYALRSNLVKDLSASPADLGVSLTASGPNATGAITTYTATVSNGGPSSATEVSLAASLPSTGVLTSAISSSGYCSTGANVTCDLGTISNGATATVTLTVNQLTPGSGVMTVEVSASQTDPNASNDQATSTTTITGSPYVPAPILLSITPPAILAGSPDTTIAVVGTGFGAGTSVQLDGDVLQTNVVSATQLSATVPAASLATLGWHAITVTNPSPGGGVSAAQPLSVYSVLKAGVNHIVYEPFSRQIFASMGSAIPQGNSVETLTPSTGVFSTPVYVGSEPTLMALSDDGQILYVLATGSSQIVRYNTLTQQPMFGFGINNSAINFAVQPGTENTLAVTGTSTQYIEIVDFDPVARTAAVRSSNSGNNSGSSPQFLDAADLVVGGSPAQQFALYSVTSTGIGTAPASYAPGGTGPFKLAQGVAYSTSGTVSDVTSQPGRLLGTFPFNVNASYAEAEAALAPDPAIGRVFYLSGLNGADYSSSTLSGIVAFDTSSFLTAAYIPLNIAAIETGSTPTPVDVVRWGQDGVAALTASGNIYLLRGGAVLPQLLQTNAPPVLNSSSPGSLGHGSGNTVLSIAGSNFLPGVAASWNGNYRTTNFVSATEITVDIPATDLTSSGTASVTATNPGSASSASILISIN